MKEKSVWNEKNSGSGADPENQQGIRSLQRMICSEGAVREARLKPKLRNHQKSWRRVDFNSVIKYRIVVQWS